MTTIMTLDMAMIPRKSDEKTESDLVVNQSIATAVCTLSQECARRGDESGGVASGRCAPRPPLQGRASKAGTTARTKGIVSTRILRRPLRSSLTLALARVYVPCMLPTPFCSPRVDAPSLQGDRRGPGRDASRGRILWSGAKTFAGIEFFPPLSPEQNRAGRAQALGAWVPASSPVISALTEDAGTDPCSEGPAGDSCSVRSSERARRVRATWCAATARWRRRRRRRLRPNQRVPLRARRARQVGAGP